MTIVYSALRYSAICSGPFVILGVSVSLVSSSFTTSPSAMTVVHSSWEIWRFVFPFKKKNNNNKMTKKTSPLSAGDSPLGFSGWRHRWRWRVDGVIESETDVTDAGFSFLHDANGSHFNCFQPPAEPDSVHYFTYQRCFHLACYEPVHFITNRCSNQ